MTANLLPVKRKNSKDGVVTVFDLASGTTLLQIPGEPMDARRGTLTPDGYTFGWIKCAVLALPLMKIWSSH